MAYPIQSPAVGTALQDLFGLQGRVRPALEEFIIPTVQVADIGQGSAPYVRRHAIARWYQAAVAAEYFTMRFEMIPGTIAVVRHMQVTAGGTGSLRVNFAGNAATIAALATTATKGFTDGRILAGSAGGGQTPAGVLTYSTSAALVGTYQGQIRLTTTPYDLYPDGWVIGTGASGLFGFLEFAFDNANQVVQGYVEWDEYQVL